MRKLLFCVSLLALLIVGTISAYNVIEVPEASARMSVATVGGGVPVASLSCTGATVQIQETHEDQYNGTAAGYSTSDDSRAARFVYTGTTGTICRLDVKISKLGSPTNNLYMYIYDGESSPTNQISACGSIAPASVGSGSSSWKTFTCADATLTHDVSYWVVYTAVSNDTTLDYYEGAIDWTNMVTADVHRGVALGSWEHISGSISFLFKIYIKE